jgi:hypothetical protein
VTSLSLVGQLKLSGRENVYDKKRKILKKFRGHDGIYTSQQLKLKGVWASCFQLHSGLPRQGQDRGGGLMRPLQLLAINNCKYSWHRKLQQSSGGYLGITLIECAERGPPFVIIFCMCNIKKLMVLMSCFCKDVLAISYPYIVVLLYE